MPDESIKSIKFHLDTLGLNQRHLEIENIDDLPDFTGVRACVSKQRLQDGDTMKCVLFDLWKGADHGQMERYSDPSGSQVPDNQIKAMLLATMCLRKELEAELNRRADFRQRIREEIAGLTGSEKRE